VVIVYTITEILIIVNQIVNRLSKHKTSLSFLPQRLAFYTASRVKVGFFLWRQSKALQWTTGFALCEWIRTYNWTQDLWVKCIFKRYMMGWYKC